MVSEEVEPSVPTTMEIELTEPSPQPVTSSGASYSTESERRLLPPESELITIRAGRVFKQPQRLTDYVCNQGELYCSRPVLSRYWPNTKNTCTFIFDFVLFCLVQFSAYF